MTDDELKNLIASIATLQKETSQQIKASNRATDRKIEETDRKIAVAERKIEEADRKREEDADKRIKETDRRIKETDRRIKDTDKRIKETDRQLKELGKQIGGLGRKFGSFTEGLALPSMQKILQDRFKMEIISPSVRIHKEGRDIEIDVLSYANGLINEAYVVEVKSHLREEGITQLQNIMVNFRKFFPEHSDKKVFGIIAAVDMTTELKKRVRALGFYTANIREDIFTLDVPDDFQAKAY